MIAGTLPTVLPLVERLLFSEREGARRVKHIIRARLFSNARRKIRGAHDGWNTTRSLVRVHGGAAKHGARHARLPKGPPANGKEREPHQSKLDHPFPNIDRH